jgi:hypothetical membrane protein
MVARLVSRFHKAGPREAGLLGLGSTAIILAGASIAGLVYSGSAGEPYSPLNHFISELGELSQSRLAAVYDSGIVAGGLGLGSFLAILARHLTEGAGRVMRVAAVVAATSGILTGLLPMDFDPVHEVVSGVFFVCAWSVAAVFSAWLLAGRRPGFPRWLLVPGLGCIPFFAGFVLAYATSAPIDHRALAPHRPDVWAVPLLEWAALLSLLSWFAALSLVLVPRRSWPAA